VRAKRSAQPVTSDEFFVCFVSKAYDNMSGIQKRLFRPKQSINITDNKNTITNAVIANTHIITKIGVSARSVRRELMTIKHFRARGHHFTSKATQRTCL